MSRSTPARPPAEPLTDGTVTLRRRDVADLDAIVAASHDEETKRWLEDEPLPVLVDDEARRAALRRADDAWTSGRAAPLVIADAETDEAAGLVNLQFRDDRTATVAYSVFPAHRGRGIAPRAVRLVVPWARMSLGVEELLLEADAGNLASIRVAEKCGFVLVEEVVDEDQDGRERRTLVHRLPE
ncbi:MAG TPA: GNAT family protein [Nocardioides sp.]|uniref:GNAT family N-acetyltransferase n=1 Tax=Nocardioides sp. TaxID=35761 RepID=UPI002E31FB0A|nr:GNAT family protein [Nocardioides sp.]HEX3931563.1 GNAT family protein [Nocardioides sp.]